MKYKLLFLISLFLILSAQSIAQTNRKNAKHQDSCLVRFVSNDSIIRVIASDSSTYFKVACNCKLVKYKLSVFNRWGNLVFSSTNILDNLNFIGLKPGTYVVIVEFKYPNMKYGKISKTIIVL